MASQIEAIDIKRKMFFEHEGAPYHCIDVEVSKPTARGGQTLVRIKMRNLLTRAVFDRTFKAGDKFQIAVFGINGPISVAPANTVWFREAKLEFYK